MSGNQTGFNFDELPEQSEQSKPSTASEPHVYRVSEINSAIRATLEGQFNRIWLRGEISNFKPHTSGHYYFSLKDNDTQISAVMFKGFNSKLKFKPENGLEVLARGKITVYEARGTYQIFCEHLEPVGAGALQKAFEQLKAKLQKEGLFAPERKKALPAYPKHIGIVTSPTGAAIRDILNVLRRRYKAARITLAPALVQGEPAPASIVSAIQLINRLSDVDVLIIGRGGGSTEDLWAFNDERVARAISASKIPTISAVGHEVDFTIADFVADLRAPTPSAAAELVVKNADEISERVQNLKARLWRAWQTHLRLLRERVFAFSKRLVDPQRKLQDLQLRNDELMVRLEAAVFRTVEDRRRQVIFLVQKMGTPKQLTDRLMQIVQLLRLKLATSINNTIERKKNKMQTAVARLDAMSPLQVVARGYSIVENSKGHVITKAKDVAVGEELNIRLASGRLRTKVTKVEAEAQ